MRYHEISEPILVALTRQARDACNGRFRGSCEGASGDLADLLKERGIPCKVIQGMYDHPYDDGEVEAPRSSHVWVETSDFILDPTREQFGSDNLVIPKTSPAARLYDGWEEMEDDA
jgi:hypothetical protein